MPFKALGLHSQLVQAAREMRYVEPTPVQTEAIPAILAGREPRYKPKRAHIRIVKHKAEADALAGRATGIGAVFP